MTDTGQRARELLTKHMVTNWLTSAEPGEFVVKADALRALTTLLTRLDDVERERDEARQSLKFTAELCVERLNRALAAEARCERLEGALREAAEKLEWLSVRDATVSRSETPFALASDWALEARAALTEKDTEE